MFFLSILSAKEVICPFYRNANKTQEVCRLFILTACKHGKRRLLSSLYEVNLFVSTGELAHPSLSTNCKSDPPLWLVKRKWHLWQQSSTELAWKWDSQRPWPEAFFFSARRFDRLFANKKKIILKESLWDQGSLPQTISLTGDWEVALTEIHYPHSWNNVQGNFENRFYLRNQELDGMWEALIVPPGYYSSVADVIYNQDKRSGQHE